MFRYSKNLKHAENKRIDDEKNAESKAKVNNVNHDNDIGNNKACNGITEFFPFTTYKIINTRVLTSHLGETASQNIIFRAPKILAVIIHASQSIWTFFLKLLPSFQAGNSSKTKTLKERRNYIKFYHSHHSRSGYYTHLTGVYLDT